MKNKVKKFNLINLIKTHFLLRDFKFIYLYMIFLSDTLMFQLGDGHMLETTFSAAVVIMMKSIRFVECLVKVWTKYSLES